MPTATDNRNLPVARQQSGAVAAPRQFKDVKSMLTDPAVQRQIARALPRHMDADRMLRIAMSAVEKQPILKECEPMSVGLSIIKAAEMGLEVDGWEGHLVPFKKKGRMTCQFIADYKGLVKLAYQSELVVEVHAEVICENDDFDYEKGTETFLRWKPARGDRGEMLGAWAGAKLKGGGFPFIVMWRDEIMQHKAKSQAAGSDFSPWNTPEGEPWMWKKTALRSLCKFLPRSTSLLELLKSEEAADTGGSVSEGVIVAGVSEEPEPRVSKADDIAGRLSGPKGNGNGHSQESEQPRDLSDNPGAQAANRAVAEEERQPGDEPAQDQRADDSGQDAQAARIAAIQAAGNVNEVNALMNAVQSEVEAGICSKDEQMALVNVSLKRKSELGRKGGRSNG